MLAAELNEPSRLALDTASGKLYIATRDDGDIVVVDVGK